MKIERCYMLNFRKSRNFNHIFLKFVKRTTILALSLFFASSIFILSNNKIENSVCANDFVINGKTISHEDLEKQKKASFLKEFVRRISFYELSELKQNSPEKLSPAILKNINVISKNVNVVENGDLDKDAEIMFDKVKSFLDDVKGKSRDYYVEKVREYLSPKNAKMQTLNSEEFAKLENNPDYFITYRGDSDKAVCEKLRSGSPNIGFYDDRIGSFSGCHSLFTCPYYSRACIFAKKADKYGEVVRFAVNKNAKLIHQDYLEAVFKRMVEKHPDYFSDYLNLTKIYGSDGFSLQLNFPHLANFVKQKAGFDFFADVDSKSADQRLQELFMALNELLGLKVEEEKLTDSQKKARDEIDKLIEQYPIAGAWIFNKKVSEANLKKLDEFDNKVFDPVQRLSCDQGLLTKLMGFDAHVKIGHKESDFDMNKAEILAKQKEGDNNFVSFPAAFFDIVNFDNVIVCSDEFKLEEKLGLSSPYETEKFLKPRLVNIFDTRSRINLYDGDINQDAEVLFEKVKQFLKEASDAGITERNIDDYSRNYIKTHVNSGSDSIAVCSDDWFAERENDPNWLILYRGIAHKPFAQEAMQGKVYIGSPVRGYAYDCNAGNQGNGICLTSTLEYARFWAKCPDYANGDKNQKFGSVLKFAIPLNSKFVSEGYLEKVFKKMLENHKDFPVFKKHAEFQKIFDGHYMCNSASFKVRADIVKEKTGFDFFADVDKKSVYEREKLFSKFENSISKKVDENGVRSPKSNEYLNELEKRSKKEGVVIVDDKGELRSTDYLVDIGYFLERNYGLLAKLMGFDVIYEDHIPPNPTWVAKPFHLLENPINDTFNVVDFSDLVVCSEPVDVPAKIEWDSPDFENSL